MHNSRSGGDEVLFGPLPCLRFVKTTSAPSDGRKRIARDVTAWLWRVRVAVTRNPAEGRPSAKGGRPRLAVAVRLSGDMLATVSIFGVACAPAVRTGHRRHELLCAYGRKHI